MRSSTKTTNIASRQAVVGRKRSSERMQGARCAGCCPFDFIFFDWSGTLALKIPVSGKEEKLANRLRGLYAALEDLITREYPSQSLPSFEKVFQNTVLAR